MVHMENLTDCEIQYRIMYSRNRQAYTQRRYIVLSDDARALVNASGSMSSIG